MNRSAPVGLAYTVELSYDVRTAGADFIFNVQAASTAQQRIVHESLGVTQSHPLQSYVDPVTHSRWLRLRAGAGPLTVRYEATVDIFHYRALSSSIDEIPVAGLPGEVLPYLYPSRYCESDKLNNFAMQQFGRMQQGYARIHAICDWVNQHVAFVSGASNGSTSALETVVQRQGVCRDFAHLMIALCRALSIPARFTTGFDYGADPALGPTDFHAY
ncbi:MAG: transglutaminase family protein, partial [Ramlibacter sp.]|nr:transglutaminase family protein [Ramlibacter sp.]